jgi:hypothetical protein
VVIDVSLMNGSGAMVLCGAMATSQEDGYGDILGDRQIWTCAQGRRFEQLDGWMVWRIMSLAACMVSVQRNSGILAESSYRCFEQGRSFSV